MPWVTFISITLSETAEFLRSNGIGQGGTEPLSFSLSHTLSSSSAPTPCCSSSLFSCTPLSLLGLLLTKMPALGQSSCYCGYHAESHV